MKRVYKSLVSMTLLLLLSGCSIIDEHLPSFWDDNESKKIIDIYISVKKIDCNGHFVMNRVNNVKNDVNWLLSYSTIKGSNDVVEMVSKFDTTLDGILSKKSISVSYCKVKKDLMKKQVRRIASGMMERY